MRAWVLVSVLAGLSMGCSDSSPTPRGPSAGGSAGSSTGPGAGGSGGSVTGVGGSGGSVAGAGGSGGSVTGTGGFSGASGGPSGGAAGTGGSAPFDGGGSDAPLVPDAPKPDVAFDWPETVPGLKCKAGHYHGTFTGGFASSATVIPLPIPVAGDIDLTLVQSANGEVLEITNGKLSGTADLIFPFAADLVGKLNCKVSKLDPMTALKNGYYVVFGNNYPFEGPFLGDYDKGAAAFVNGTWDVKEPDPIYGGNGTWEATWVGP